MLITIISPTHDSSSYPHLPLADQASTVMDDPTFIDYVLHHGYHFTQHLAESVRFHNADGTAHHWNCDEVRSALSDTVPVGWTIGDVTVQANWLYSDLVHPTSPIKTEKDVLSILHLALNDPDGHPGQTFLRWISDVIATNRPVIWS